MSSEQRPFAIEADGLGKRYEIYAAPQDRLKQMVLPRISRLLGRKPSSYFREFWALHDVSFNVRRGETVAIIGQNGSGKSTLLQLVCGTIYPSRGEVATHGRIAALLELGAGFNPEFTGEENVYLSGMLYGLTEAQLAERFDSIVKFAEIGEFISQPVKTYSSGMYVRLAFAIAAHVDADVLIVDEALSVGDVRFTQKCMRFLREFQKNGTLLFVSHDTGAVTNLCSRAIWLDHGVVRMDGDAKETVEAYLAEQHALDRGAQGAVVKVAAAKKQRENVPIDVVDSRWSVLRQNGVATRIEVFEFDPESWNGEFGARDAIIDDVTLTDESGRPLALVHGSEIVQLKISARVHAPLQNLIFGFYFKDRLGQRLFGDNTFLTHRSKQISGDAGQRWSAMFRFRMPMLPTGPYSIDVALATGTQDDHTQQHWIHDALTLRAVESSMRYGLVGIPMLDITISNEE
ncbi:TPA: ABC transporter ATP-binding protein [Burkholderia multivorans]|uniref:ABC transporter ATP-binding protein n=1 Tax=Burkholderia multivorans TaxID=87883 RepID=UPI000D010FCF|nr:ABC transporter ATP-binding protein [Burkholderia multivorans]MBU9301181.1 ABC transporter ATP-binding protein [Burkholderia multivorans]MBU9305668.1 ABC transporter ATP-binding protein [Burkholderia multivorans]MBU9409632.1 ABC transporter ATP-binding protein [Burkholderia multivorans]MBU9510419.1 ABC transporter ATP-binding protein [Burkholderia multivorans]MCA8462500.1 ABC transporter ATP-binding protein [Burkholderia multivorans]